MLIKRVEIHPMITNMSPEEAISPATLQEIIRDALAASPADWNYQSSPSLEPGSRCCVCGDLLELGKPGEVWFESTASLPIHEECHHAKEGMSSAACRLSLGFGYSFLLRFAMEGKGGWKKQFFQRYIHSQGVTAGKKLIGHGVEWWKRSDGFTDFVQFTRWTRYAYIFERVAPKFEFR